MAQGQPAQIAAALRGAPEATVKVRWSRDGQEITRTTATLDASGAAETTITDPHPGPGIHVYRAQIVDALKGGPTFAADGPSLNTAVTVGGKPRVLVLTIDGSCPAILCDALDKADVDKQVLTLPEGMPDAAALSAPISWSSPTCRSRAWAPRRAARASRPPRSRRSSTSRRRAAASSSPGRLRHGPEYAGTPSRACSGGDRGQRPDRRSPRGDGDHARSLRLDGRHGRHSHQAPARGRGRARRRGHAARRRSLALGSVDEETHWDHPSASSPASPRAARASDRSRWAAAASSSSPPSSTPTPRSATRPRRCAT